MSSSKVIGLTGGIGTGKSTAASYLIAAPLECGRFVHIDADAISRELTRKIPGEDNPVLEEIGREFDPDPVLREDGSLDRAAMADLVFADPGKKQRLESILFTHIIAEIHAQIDRAKEAGRPVLLDAPLLFEAGLDSLCDETILLTADHDVRIHRVTLRDGSRPEDVEARIRNQMPDEQKIPRADIIVDNSGTEEDLQLQLDRALARIFTICD